MADIEIQVDASGAKRLLGLVKATRADKIVGSSFGRVAGSVRNDIAKVVRSRFKELPEKEIKKRITIDRAKRRFRIYGAGPKKGSMFVRPRFLGLVAKRGARQRPWWTGLRTNTFARSFAATPLKGSKDGGTGRNFALANVRIVIGKSRKNARTGKVKTTYAEKWITQRQYNKKNAVVFQRQAGGRDFMPIRGPDTMGAIVKSMIGAASVRNMLTKKLEAEMKRRIDAIEKSKAASP